MNIGIIGLGLMGGSFAKAVKKYGIAKKVFGYARSEATKKEIEELNLVDELVNIEELKTLCDVIILAVPVDTIISLFPKFLDTPKTTTIIDMGSTKEKIINEIPTEIRGNFIAAHPMTGTEKSGPKSAIDELYEGKTVVLCNLEENNNIHVDRAFKIFQDIGMRIVVMDAKEHDIHACYMSHLPHAISYALANTVMNHEDPKAIIALAAGGFKDMSRIAKSSPSMWGDIFEQNRGNLVESIDIFIKQMNEVRRLVKECKSSELREWMAKANTLHEIL